MGAKPGSRVPNLEGAVWKESETGVLENLQLLRQGHLQFHVPPSADFQPTAYPAEAIGLFGRAFGAADVAGEGLGRSGFKDRFSSGLHNLGVHHRCFVRWFRASFLPHPNLRYQLTIGSENRLAPTRQFFSSAWVALPREASAPRSQRAALLASQRRPEWTPHPAAPSSGGTSGP